MATRKVKLSGWARFLLSVRTNARVWVTVAISSGIAVATGWASYSNLRAALVMAHADPTKSNLLAAVPDLLMALSLLSISTVKTGYRASAWVWATFWFGLASSLAGNEVCEWSHGWLARVVGVLVPLGVMLAVETVRHARKHIRKPARTKAQNGTVKAPERAVQTSTAHLGTQGHALPVTA